PEQVNLLADPERQGAQFIGSRGSPQGARLISSSFALLAASRAIHASPSGYSVISRITRHGLPAANTPSGMSLVTTLPAPMTVFEPIFTPGQMIALPPTQTSDPISMGLANSWGQEEDKRRSQEAGFNFHMVKPVDP